MGRWNDGKLEYWNGWPIFYMHRPDSMNFGSTTLN